MRFKRGKTFMNNRYLLKYSIIKTGYVIIDVEKNNKVIAIFYDKKIAQSFINLLNGLNQLSSIIFNTPNFIMQGKRQSIKWLSFFFYVVIVLIRGECRLVNLYSVVQHNTICFVHNVEIALYLLTIKSDCDII